MAKLKQRSDFENDNQFAKYLHGVATNGLSLGAIRSRILVGWKPEDIITKGKVKKGSNRAWRKFKLAGSPNDGRK